ncbi:MAG: SUMF1/EgtB/PvdO family nonheme iron enzyme [bacterium]
MAAKGRNRVNRGGSWNNDPINLRCAYRNYNDPENSNDNLGFRLASSENTLYDDRLTRPLSCPD